MTEDVQFEDEQGRRPAAAAEKSLLVRLVLSTRLVQTDRQAEYVLLGVASVVILIAILIWSFASSPHPPVPLPPGTLIPGPNGSATYTK